MKRISEKIKDLVDVRDYETVNNFGGDAESTVVAYHFTDATAELMAKWLDEIIELAHRETGTARALAGNRGVGKSHFIGVFGSLAAHPELRTRLADSHVVSSAKRLPRSKHSAVRVERGTAPNLIEELRNALNKTFSENSQWGENVRQMLTAAAARNEDLPLVILVDSAFDRLNRVKREDGALLGEMAETARTNKIFLAVALDDDIAGADGVNAAIARTFTIDFLDQEHLYRVVDSYLFQKRPVARAKLHDLYLNLRETSPGFNWSEPRFNALYPIHPVVVDVTPSVRLYAPKFAFLPFAAESASKVMSRPAHSLIALDEVFDRVESELRKADELSEAFATYDDLAANAVPLIPVMQRLQAKLVLKGLLIFSLDGRGATARELGAAMLITEESQPEIAVTRIEEMILRFTTVAPSDKLHCFNDGNENRYSLGGGIGATFETRLTEAAQSVEPETIGRVMRRVGQARFSDWVFNDFNVSSNESVAEFAVQWRGSMRRGRIAWEWETSKEIAVGENQDWQIFIRYSKDGATKPITTANPTNALVVEWQPAVLRRDEDEAVRRYAALLTAPELTIEFGETAVAAEQTASALVERIWTRIFLEEGKLIVNGSPQTFDENAKSAAILSETLSHALAPNFAETFPSHPDFPQLLTFNEVSQIVSELFGAADATSPTTQHLAHTFALPLGLVVPRGANLVLETDENLLKLPLLQSVWKTVERADNEVVSINEIAQVLKSAPFGLQREAQNLILAALVARRRLEFVTGRNERIGRRSLDLKIIWADIKGVAQSATLPRSSAELANWAKLLTGKNGFASTDEPSEALRIRESLQSWRGEWNETRILPKFEELPDEILNLRAWRLASHTERTFGAAAEAVEAILADEITLEEGLERVIDAFGDAPEQILSNQRELVELQNFVGAADSREKTRRYLALAEATNDE
ncbi:MAG: hypothetical protein H7Z37_06925, partial [Pyrinomonadaceae bacterium]|nr:hypothetical protein [Pyrinomonadaceae bacterium]